MSFEKKIYSFVAQIATLFYKVLGILVCLYFRRNYEKKRTVTVGYINEW